MTSDKKVEPPEESIPMRVLCGILAVIAITVSFVFGKSPVPVVDFSPMQAAAVLLSVWLCIGGSMLSFYYRHQIPKVVSLLIKVGAVLIVLNLARELILDNLHAQQFQFLYPLVDALVAASILTSFELKTRNDIISSAAFGLCLMALAACSGRSIIFGACVLLYIILGAALLTYSAQSQTCELPHADKRLVTTASRGLYRPAIVVCATLLPIFSIAAFSVMPRLDAEADSLSSRVRSWASSTVYDARRQKQQQPALVEEPANRRHKYSPPDIQTVDATGDEASADDKPTKGHASAKAADGVDPSRPASGEKRDGTSSTANGKSGATNGRARATNDKPHTTSGTPPEPEDKSSKLFEKLIDHYRKRKAQEAAVNQQSSSDEAVSAALPSTTKNSGAVPPLQNKPIATSVENRPKSKQNASNKLPQLKNSALSTARAATGPAERSVATGNNNKKTASIARLDASDISLEDSASSAETPVFTLACNRNVYVKTACLDYFDGHQWTRSDQKDCWTFSPTDKGVDLADCPSLHFTDALPVMELTENFTLKADFGYMVPSAGIPQRLSLPNEVSVDTYGDVKSALPMIKGTSYTAVCQWPVYSVQELRHSKCYADPDAADTDRYLQLPQNQSPETISLANDLIEPGFNRFVQAEHITTYLRNHYKYNLSAMSGQAQDNLADEFLLNRKSGDCKAFASAFVVLCRAAGIPARFIGGFMPGDFDAVRGSTTVKMKHGHAWAEIFMAPYGWVAFDPTPGGLLPARPEEKYYNYHELHKQISKDATSSAAKTLMIVETAFTDIGYAIALSAVALTITALILSIRASRKVFQQLWDALKPKHPAIRMRNRVLKKLRKIGVVREPADTAADVVHRLEVTLAKLDNRDLGDTNILKDNVCQFFDTYNAVYFGNYTGELGRLKTLASSISEQIK